MWVAINLAIIGLTIFEVHMINAPVKWFETSVLAISAFNLFVVSLTMLWNIRRIQPASVLLLVWLLIAGVAIIMMFSIDTGLIVYAPHLYLLPSPLYYLLFPAGYLYIRMVLHDEVRLSRWDALHVLPALVHFVELSPFYFQNYAHKLQVVREVVERPLGAFVHAEGFLSDYQHNILRGIVGFGYILAIYRQLYLQNNERNHLLAAFPAMVRWLKTFGVLQVIIAITLVSFLGIPWLAPPPVRATLLYVLIALSLTGTTLILIFNRGLMYGMPKFAERHTAPHAQPILPVDAIAVVKPAEVEMRIAGATAVFSKGAGEQQQLLLSRIEKFMDTQKPYLKKRYNTTDLSNDLAIPAHHISYLLNHVLKLKYTDYVNQKRIEHMQRLVESGDLEHFTLEALALKSGFNSRITFIRAVQKLKAMNPSEYFKV